MAIDWSLLGDQPNFASLVSEGMQTGRAMAKERRLDRAFGDLVTNPDSAISEITAVDPATGIALRKDRDAQTALVTRKATMGQYATDPTAARGAALASGDVDLIDWFDKADETTRKHASEHAESLSGLAQALRQRPVEERASVIAHLTPQLLQRYPGLKAEDLQGVDLSDAALEALIGQMKPLTVGGSLIDPTTHDVIYEQPQRVPPGFEYGEDGQLRFTPGGPADPAYVGAASSARAGGVAAHRKPSGGHGATSTGAPPGFVLD